MAKIILLHLSDVHIADGREPILKYAPQITNAVQNIAPDASHLVIAVSGDLAYSGLPEQYDAFWTFLGELQTHLNATFVDSDGSPIPMTVVAVPGNHDCDFSGDQTARELIRKPFTENARPEISESIVSICTEVQNGFFEFLSVYATPDEWLGNPTGTGRLAYRYTINAKGKRLVVNCLNTAWLSVRNEEQSKLYFPEHLVPERTDDDDFVVTIFHHPHNWNEASNAKEFRNRVASVSNLVLTGHEHLANSVVQSFFGGNTSTVVEGGSLNDPATTEPSAFFTFVIDLDNRRTKTARFELDNGRFAIPAAYRSSSSDDEFGLEWQEYPMFPGSVEALFAPTDQTRQWTESLELDLQLSRSRDVNLSDLFVFPDLQEISEVDSANARKLTGPEGLEVCSTSPHVLLLGDEQSGKTAIAKVLFNSILKRGQVPIYIDLATFPSIPAGRTLPPVLTNAFDELYGAEGHEAFTQLPKASKSLLVDNAHGIIHDRDKRERFFQALTDFAGQVIILCDESVFHLSGIDDVTWRSSVLSTFSAYKMMKLNHKRRGELIRKWSNLSLGTNATPGVLAHTIMNHTAVVDGLVGKSLLAPYPVYVLIALDNMRLISQSNANIGSYGAYYELVIKNSLALRHTALDYHIVSAFLTHLANHLYTTQRRRIDETEFRRLERDFRYRFDLDETQHNLTSDLVRSGILVKTNADISFRHPFVFFYYVASWLDGHLHADETQQVVSKLCRSLHHSESANILLFLCHLSKDPFIVRTLLEAANQYYPADRPFEFGADAFPFDEMRSIERRAVIESTDVEKNHDEMLARRDRYNPADEAEGDLKISLEEVTDIDIEDPLQVSIATFKTLEIMGQLLKNFPAGFERDEKLLITKSTVDLALRWLGSTLSQLERFSGDFTKHLMLRYAEGPPPMTVREAAIKASDTISAIAELFGTIVVVNLAHNVGAPHMISAYERLKNEDGRNSDHLLWLSVLLRHRVGFGEQAVVETNEHFKTSPFARAVLVRVVQSHFYLFPVEPGAYKRVCELLDIETSEARRMSANRAEIVPKVGG